MSLNPADTQACLIGIVQILIGKGLITMDEWKQAYTDGRAMVDEAHGIERTGYISMDELFDDTRGDA